MKARFKFLNPIVAALCANLLLADRVLADGAALRDDVTAQQAAGEADSAGKIGRLLAELQRTDAKGSARIERELLNEWSKSGSAAMDLLLQRGLDALAMGDAAVAIGHLTALTDHAPEFAEGWNARAAAYFQAGLIGPAVADLAQALRLNPSHFGALSGLGGIHEQLDRPEAALEIYRAALAIHPHLATVSAAIKRLEEQVAGTEL